MAKKKKLTEVELKIKNFKEPEIDYSYQKSISYSQFSIYSKCPHQWYLSYVLNKKPYEASIHTVFGTAFHETLQHYIEVMYSKSGAEADRIDLEEYFQERFIFNYDKEYKGMGYHFSSPEEMGEFFDDAIAILNWIKKRRNKIFTIRKVKLLGIELPLLINLSKNIFLKGYIDLVLYDEDLNQVQIIDIKTSTRGWREEYEKKDESKISQLIIYKEYFASQFGIDPDNIKVQYFIVRRKIWESEFPIPRVQTFEPVSGKIKRNQVKNKLEEFIKSAFDDEGKPIIKEHNKNASEHNCKFCPYNFSEDLCNKN